LARFRRTRRMLAGVVALLMMAVAALTLPSLFRRVFVHTAVANRPSVSPWRADWRSAPR
jgi:hypothetical protein